MIAGVVLCLLAPGGLKGVEACKGKTEEVKKSQERGPGGNTSYDLFDLLDLPSSAIPLLQLRLIQTRGHLRNQ